MEIPREELNENPIIEIDDIKDNKQIIRNFGENKEYLSFMITRENFKYIPIDLSDFNIIDLIYNQFTEKIILDCYGKHDIMIDTEFDSSDFFKILYKIKAKDI